MTVVVAVQQLRRSEISALFEGAAHGGVEISIFVTTWPAGRGPRLHKHPYAEVFLIEEGQAAFVIDREQLTVAADHIVVVPANTPHRFENAGRSPLRLLSIQPSPNVIQTDLE
jgi:mannose-6-phosphate isomerase-like protein (cupin superfamily)